MASLQSVTHWADETDVLICGYGLAGATAAIEAHDLDPDADILILEKMPEAWAGGNSRVWGQSLLISKNKEALKSYQRAMSQPNPIPEDMLDAWAERMVTLEPYIEARAAEVGATYLHGTGWSERDVVLEFPELGAAEAVALPRRFFPCRAACGSPSRPMSISAHGSVSASRLKCSTSFRIPIPSRFSASLPRSLASVAASVRGAVL